jgi:hypothetical protein
VDRMLRPVHRWVWGDFNRRVRKLIAFAQVEGDGGRDILRAAELTPDPLLRRLYLEHAIASCATRICSVSAALPSCSCARLAPGRCSTRDRVLLLNP